MNFEKSCGAVVFTKINNNIYFLIIRSLEGIYGFPKGHMEKGETEEETALREIKEETGITPCIIDGFLVRDEYPLPRKKDTIKQVTYFLAEYNSQDIKAQKEELMEAALMSFEEAISVMQFENTKQILKQANEFLLKGDF
ncbi:MAG: NUDIX domain-containing protein [Clostridia bacterium]|nr:NUDIX domain-containing protein [Clostridia bacterium]